MTKTAEDKASAAMGDSKAPHVLPDYPQVERGAGILVHTRKQAEAGRIKVAGKRISHEGRVNEGEKPQ